MVAFAGYTLNLRALLARLLYPWRIVTISGILLLIMSCGLLSGIIPPFWRGQGQLVITAAPATTLTINGRPGTANATVRSGDYHIVATTSDGAASWADVTVRSGITTTLTLPPPLRTTTRTIPVGAPGSILTTIWWANNGWRITSNPLSPTAGPSASGPTPTPEAGQTVALVGERSQRIPTIDAYAGIADEMQIGGRSLSAVFVGQRNYGGSVRDGVIAVTGWTTATTAFTTTSGATLVRFAPDGNALVFGEQIGSGTRLSVGRRDGSVAAIVALPDPIIAIDWQDGRSDALAVVSANATRMTLTMARLGTPTIAAVVADIPERITPPIAWTADALHWIATDARGERHHYQAPLATLIPERREALDAVAFRFLPRQVVPQIIIRNGASLAIGQYDDRQFIGVAMLPDIPADAPISGRWHATTVLLRTADAAWIVEASDGP